MPKSSGGAQQLRRGDRIRIQLSGSYRHYLNGLTGRVTQVLHHGVIVALDNDPVLVQRVMGTGGSTGPKNPTLPQRQFMFNEVVKI
jgi:hypothetical protein